MIFDELMDALAQNGWQIRRRDEICPPQSEFLGGRFKNLSEDFYRFVCSFETLHDAADAVWFVSARDYASPSTDETEFHYGDFEKDSLECTANDAQRAAVRAFWSGCLPFLFSVRGERCFAGILTQGADAGKIIIRRGTDLRGCPTHRAKLRGAYRSFPRHAHGQKRREISVFLFCVAACDTSKAVLRAQVKQRRGAGKF